MGRPGWGWMGWLAGVTALAGFGIAAIALFAALGVWVGAWDFRRGFTLLRFANSYAGWIAVAGLVATAVLLVSGRVAKHRAEGRLAAMALAGTLAAAAGHYVPESFRPPDGVVIPPIHDVSTDTVDPPQYVSVLPLRADAPNTTVYGGSQGMTPERLAQLQTEAFPDVRTLQLNAPPSEVFDRALAVVRDLGWELVAAVPEEGRIEATDTTFWFRFKDDVVIRIRPAESGSLVDARSLSRVGGGDLGTNARRLRAFLARVSGDPGA